MLPDQNNFAVQVVAAPVLANTFVNLQTAPACLAYETSHCQKRPSPRAKNKKHADLDWNQEQDTGIPPQHTPLFPL